MLTRAKDRTSIATDLDCGGFPYLEVPLPAFIRKMLLSKASILSFLATSTAIQSITTSTTQNTVTNNLLSRENTQACNNYVEFCQRKYSNITEVCAHNSPFHVKGSLSSNQLYDVITQLDDGIRMLEGQIHMLDGVLHYCHTACFLLDGGTVESYFKKISDWLQNHPFEVVTILIANGDGSPVTDLVNPIENSGLNQYVYIPPKIPMTLNDWPTLGELIKENHRVIILIDYGANQKEIPYILDQYSQLWETPFSPTDANFPCVINRPPNLSAQDAKDRLYLANHNLNTKLNISNLNILIPDLANIYRTNGVDGFGSLGLASDVCASKYGRPPNFLVVDYYNCGRPSSGSVFQVAAKANAVKYTRPCCGPNLVLGSNGNTSGITSTRSPTPTITMSSMSDNISTGKVSGSVWFMGLTSFIITLYG